jgi:hypothetical protein
MQSIEAISIAFYNRRGDIGGEKSAVADSLQLAVPIFYSACFSTLESGRINIKKRK